MDTKELMKLAIDANVPVLLFPKPFEAKRQTNSLMEAWARANNVPIVTIVASPTEPQAF